MTWFRRRTHHPPSEGTKARKRAEKDLVETKAETVRYRALAESLREIRQRNHFADSITATFRGDRP